MADIEILGFPQSNFVWATRIALTEMGVPHTLVQAAPHTPDLLACNPVGKMPGMRHGDLRMGESRAIIAYAEKALAKTPITPADPAAAARAEQWASIASTTFDPVMIRAYVLSYLFPGTPDGAPDRARIDGAVAKMPAMLDLVEKAVTAGELGTGPITVADCYLVPTLGAIGLFPEGKAMIAERPALAGWLAARMGHPSVRATMPPMG